MGKYIRKAKTTGEVTVMEFSQSSLGVRTRARTLALQKSSPTTTTTTTGSYLQLRSRRLEKPPIILHDSAKRHKQKVAEESCAQQNPRDVSRRRAGPKDEDDDDGGAEEEAKEIVIAVGGDKEKEVQEKKETSNKDNVDLGVEEAFFGENVLEFEGRERNTRESTPCSLIRDPETIKTPGSTTRRTVSTETNLRAQNAIRRHIPTAHEMDEFFAGAEEEQQRQFIEKYNFDPVNDRPLPGCYEWEKLDP